MGVCHGCGGHWGSKGLKLSRDHFRRLQSDNFRPQKAYCSTGKNYVEERMQNHDLATAPARISLRFKWVPGRRGQQFIDVSRWSDAYVLRSSGVDSPQIQHKMFPARKNKLDSRHFPCGLILGTCIDQNDKGRNSFSCIQERHGGNPLCNNMCVMIGLLIRRIVWKQKCC